MKLLIISTAYSSYINNFYKKNSDLQNLSYCQQKQKLDYDSFGWANFWSNALLPHGYNVLEVIRNAEYLQTTWERENIAEKERHQCLNDITLKQAKKFQPDILWYNDYNEDLLNKICDEVSSIRLVLGRVGSAIPKTNIWRRTDLVITCAPEAMERLEKKGVKVEHIDHAFETSINQRLQETKVKKELSFIGNIGRGSQFHLERERILIEISKRMSMDIYSSSSRLTIKDNIEHIVRLGAFKSVHWLENMGLSINVIGRIPIIGKAVNWDEKPACPFNPELKPYLKPEIYGLSMYQLLKDSKVTLNIHADSSPRYASNMRLFEATGVGTCLLTDWKSNINQLFEPDKEIITYKSVDECIEKVKWLNEHPIERETIAQAGKIRTLKEHTFANRAVMLNNIIKRELKNRTKKR